MYSDSIQASTQNFNQHQHQANDYKSGFIYEFNLKKEWWESIEVKPESADEEELRVNFPLELLLKLCKLSRQSEMIEFEYDSAKKQDKCMFNLVPRYGQAEDAEEAGAAAEGNDAKRAKKEEGVKMEVDGEDEAKDREREREAVCP